MKKPAFMKAILLFFLILNLSIIGFSKEKTIASQWVTSPLEIDGTASEWEEEALNFEKKIGVDYAFKNDGENLFVLFIFKDPSYLSTIRETGMTFWFNTEGKKKKNYGIQFIKKQVSAEVFIAILEQKRGPLPEQEKNNIRVNPNYVLHNAKVINKKSKSSSQASDREEVSPAIFRTTRQKNMFVYEFAIPLERATELAPGIGTEPGKIIKVGFEWGGLTKEMKEARMRRESEAGIRPSKPRVSTDSWSKGSSYGSGSSGLSRSTKKYSLWVDVQLAKHQ